MTPPKFIIIKYKYDDCPVCFPKDSNAGIAFINDILDPREMKNQCYYYELTKVYDNLGSFKGSMLTYKKDHSVDVVYFCKGEAEPTKKNSNFIVYSQEIYSASDNKLAIFMLDEDQIIREYATRVYKTRDKNIF